MKRTIASLALALCLGLALVASQTATAAEGATPEAGLVVEGVTPESLGARAGFQTGDVLLFWCRAGSPAGPCLAEGRLESAFDFEELDLEQAPRGGVRILGKRDAAGTTWALLPGTQSIEVRPILPEPLLRFYREGRSLAASRPEDAAERWRSAAAQAQKAGDARLGAWFLSRGAAALSEAHQWPQGDALHDEAAAQARLLREQTIEAKILKTWGENLQIRGDLEKAETLYRRSLELDQAAGHELAVAWSLDHLGTLVAQHANPQEAETLLRQALEILEKLAPASSNLAESLRDLGSVMQLRGDLASAELHLGRALSILDNLSPGSLDTADVMISISRIRIDRGNLAGAEADLRRATAICDRVRPESMEMARALNSLGLTAIGRGDREDADYYLKRALAIRERLDPNGATVATTLENLGLQALEREDLTKAEEYLRRAMSLNDKLAPEGPAIAHNLQNLGVIAIHQGDCTAAESHFQHALAIRQRLGPGSLNVAASLRSLGFHGLKCGDLSRAESCYRQALALYESLAPGGIHEALVLHDLGDVYQQMGRSLPAAESLCRAVDVYEALQEGPRRDVLTEGYFTSCLFARAEMGQAAEAFRVLERGRARAFLDQLATRDLTLSADLPDEVALRRKQLAQEIDSTQGALARLSSTHDAKESERLLNRLREIRSQQRELTEQIKRSSPRFASLHYPQSLDLAGAREALDPGTVLLSYAVGEKKSYLFVLHSPEIQDAGFSVFPLPIGEKALREAVQAFRNLLQNRESDRSTLAARASGLYDLLIGPAEAQVAVAKRILISADGPLHTLPFAALVRQGRYLIEWKAVHSVLSATVYAELKRTRHTSADPADSELVAFGSPTYSTLPKNRETAPTATLEILTEVRRGLSLDPIPSTRKEVESIAALYPHSRVYLGPEATEERAKSVGPQARLLHFACHGLLNERFPLDSALALTIPEHPTAGQDNGLLQAWEILESVRLDADLVTLSACDTALGQEMGGEGLIGLTRAFQYAGARSVLASLWSVSDISTADLMRRFYSHLRAGKGKDEALQAAQSALIRSPEFSHPYYWAAFQLVGDWK